MQSVSPRVVESASILVVVERGEGKQSSVPDETGILTMEGRKFGSEDRLTRIELLASYVDVTLE